jgi:hypothetical protein
MHTGSDVESARRLVCLGKGSLCSMLLIILLSSCSSSSRGSRERIGRHLGMTTWVLQENGGEAHTGIVILSIPIRIARNVLLALLLLSSSPEHLVEEIELER